MQVETLMQSHWQVAVHSLMIFALVKQSEGLVDSFELRLACIRNDCPPLFGAI